MRFRLKRLIAALAFGCVVLPAVPALAGFGAIAWDKTTGKYGWAFNEPTPQKAIQGSLSQCGASGCRVIIRTAAKRCAAIATIEGGKVAGAAARGTLDAARVSALANCKKQNAGECVIRGSDCNK